MKDSKFAKVLFVSPVPPPLGGIATWTKSIIDWADNNNRVIKIVNTSKSTEINTSPGEKISLKSQLKRTRSIHSELKKALNKREYNVVHVNSSGSFPGILRDLFVVRYANKHCDKIVLQLHYDAKKIYENEKKTQKILKKMINMVEEVWVLNQESYDFIKSITNNKTIRIIPNFVDSIIINDNPKFNPLLKNVGFLGSISKGKGIREILEVAKKINNVNFHLVGPIVNDTMLINKPNNVIVHGALNHIEALKKIKEMDVFLFPSYSEGFSIAILEAMSQGLPIITTPVGANKELIGDSGGFIVNIGDEDQIINRLKQLGACDIRKRMGINNIKIVSQQYTSKVVIASIFSYYDQMVLID